MTKAVVLLSGGLDSSVLLSKVVKHYSKDNVTALSIYYGQKHKKEAEYAEYQANSHGVELLSMNLDSLYKYDKGCTLLEGNGDIPAGVYSDQLEETKIVSTYVPFRNGLFLSSAAALAIQLGAQHIFYGAHADDSGKRAYPDCSSEFIETMSQAISAGTGGEVTLIAPFKDMTKKDIVWQGHLHDVDFSHTWSCYEGKEVPCGTCATCLDRAQAFAANDLEDK